MGARMREFDWRATPLGAPADWPLGLKAAVQIMLTSRFAMWMAWGEALTFFCNDAYLPTTGLKRDWVLGARSDLVWAEIWADIGPRIARVRQAGEATWDEALLLYLERSGFAEETYHTFSYSPLADDSGAIAGMLCVVAEVTERVIGERQLALLRDLGARLASAPTRAEAMAAFEQSLQALPQDIPFALAYLRHEAGHAELAAVHGLDRGAAWLAPRVDPADAASPWPFGAVLASGAQVVAFEAPPGSFTLRFWQSPPRQAIVVPIVGAEGGTPVGFLVAGLNPHRNFESGYRGFVGLLAGQLAAAIARADEYERERARAEALAEIDRAKTAFFSNVSHEFRTPLTLMLGPLEDALADRASLPAAQAERVELAQRNGMRLLRLVNALLDFSRIEAGRMQANYRPVDLSRLTAELASTFRSACDRAGLTLTVDCPEMSQDVFVDAEMWERIVLNLLSNAFKFTLQGGICVALREHGTTVELEVRDTGVGIPESELPHLFERFHRVEGARGRSFEGSGIGLALVHDLVRLQGGEVDVESQEGRFTSFRVQLPLGRAHLPADRVGTAQAAAANPALAHAFADEALRWLPDDAAVVPQVIRDAGAGAAAASASGRLREVLLADDNADLRDYVGRLLQDRGYAVRAVADGAAALAAARERRPDLILTDVMMPLLDGFGLLAAIRADAALADIPVLMLSARAGEEAQVEGLGAGADDYLAKPFSARELLARVAANLDMARTRREAAEALRLANASLEQRVADAVAEREAALTRLAEAQKMEMLGQLTGGVAHDFNNLLTPIMGSLDLLRQRHEDAGSQRLLGGAQQSAERARALIGRLLTFARKQSLAPRPFDAAALVSGLRELIERSLGQAFQLHLEVAPGLPAAMADPNQMELALLNLAVNGRDAMQDAGRHDGQLTIEVREDRTPPPTLGLPQAAYIRFAVTDSGIGMDAATLKRAVEPFFSTKAVGRGTGLGLATVHGLALQSGGALHLESEPGTGTTASIWLPVTAEQPAAMRDAPPVADPVKLRVRLLVVDDEPLVRSTTAALLEELGYDVVEAASAAAALEAVRGGLLPALVITDHMMPGMTGAQLAIALRGHLPGVPVLMITGFADLRPEDAAGLEVLTKPFTFAELRARIVKLMAPAAEVQIA